MRWKPVKLIKIQITKIPSVNRFPQKSVCSGKLFFGNYVYYDKKETLFFSTSLLPYTYSHVDALKND